MKKVLKIFVLFFSFGLFFSCGDDTEEINRYKNGYRDPKLIGEWCLLGIEHLDYKLIQKFTKEGEWRILRFESSGKKTGDNLVGYYYTKDNVIYSFVPGNFKEPSDHDSDPYEIKNDTMLFLGYEPRDIYKAK